MWKQLRTCLAVICFAGCLLLFCDRSEGREFAQALAWFASMQLVPAMLAGGFVVAGIILATTMLLGRVYCSVICPLGILQDVLASLRQKRRYAYRKGHPFLRVFFLGVFLIGFVLGIPVVYGLLEPYSAFGRMAASIGEPVSILAHNGVEWLVRKTGSFALAPQPLVFHGWTSLFTAIATLAIIAFLTIRHGRIWCNTVCPVGTVLGLLSRYACIRPRIDVSQCVHCGKCATGCKAGCIDAENGTVDSSRCVACWNCVNTCTQGALHFLPGKALSTTEKRSRRAALAALPGLLALPFNNAFAAESKGDQDIPALRRKERRAYAVPVLPPGAVDARRFSSRCTGCQLCVTACPHDVLHPRGDGTGLLQPVMSFEYGFCHFKCVACGMVCPTEAITRLSPEEKASIQVGRAVVHPDICVVTTDQVTCTACQRACPTGAISLVGEEALKRPAVDAEKCIGCGACEYICPARPLAAIQIEGNVEQHRL